MLLKAETGKPIPEPDHSTFGSLSAQTVTFGLAHRLPARSGRRYLNWLPGRLTCILASALLLKNGVGFGNEHL